MNRSDAPAGVSMGEASRLTGLPVETLRYYDRAGLLGDLPRTGGNHRVFDELTLGLLDVVVRLRRTGMPIEDVRRFAELVRAGDDDRPTRIALLQTHRARPGAARPARGRPGGRRLEDRRLHRRGGGARAARTATGLARGAARPRRPRDDPGGTLVNIGQPIAVVATRSASCVARAARPSGSAWRFTTVAPSRADL